MKARKIGWVPELRIFDQIKNQCYHRVLYQNGYFVSSVHPFLFLTGPLLYNNAKFHFRRQNFGLFGEAI